MSSNYFFDIRNCAEKLAVTSSMVISLTMALMMKSAFALTVPSLPYPVVTVCNQCTETQIKDKAISIYALNGERGMIIDVYVLNPATRVIRRYMVSAKTGPTIASSMPLVASIKADILRVNDGINAVNVLVKDGIDSTLLPWGELGQLPIGSAFDVVGGNSGPLRAALREYFRDAFADNSILIINQGMIGLFANLIDLNENQSIRINFPDGTTIEVRVANLDVSNETGEVLINIEVDIDSARLGNIYIPHDEQGFANVDWSRLNGQQTSQFYDLANAMGIQTFFGGGGTPMRCSSTWVTNERGVRTLVITCTR